MTTTPRVRRRFGFAHLLSVLAFAVLGLAPGTASAWWSHDWAYRRAITITPPKAGEGVTEVPILVRLHDGNFHFDQAAADGADLRFVAEDDKTPLKFHIEKYDSVFNLAAVWVRVPAIKSGGPTTLFVYYGNAKAVTGSEPGATYDALSTLVWHFNERNAPPLDATVNGNTGTTPATADDDGLVGGAVRLDGTNVLGIPGSPTLAFPQGGPMTWSAWIKPSETPPDGTLYARHDGARSFVIGFEKGAPYIAIATDGGVTQRSAPAPAITPTAWHHLAVVAAERQITLFVDGGAGPVLAFELPALASPASVGADAGAPGFVGVIDELEIAKVARSPGWLALAVNNQGAGDSIVGVGLEEQLSTWSSGYVGVILSSVTLDGWVVIGVLGVMAVISWMIMFTKARQISRVGGANRSFLRVFRKVGDDWGAMATIADGTAAVSGIELSEGERRRMQRSPLLHMFNAGVDELQTRLVTRQNKGLKGPLSSRAIEAIRASLDASLVTEMQRLNRLMVLLTIAISGGPFIGLLGTVVGVMITFAAIAASGDVNVNSIAPGIAAALAATVAGLVVAIPALFGYNYLISRIKEITAEMNVFLDAFVTRMAEGDDAAETLIDGAH